MFSFLLDSTGGSGTPENPMGSYIYMGILILMLVVMYFVVIRPQKKQEKQVQEMREQLQVGDEITTIGGIIGKIISIKEETVMIETGHDRTKIRVLRDAIKKVDVKAEDAQ